MRMRDIAGRSLLAVAMVLTAAPAAAATWVRYSFSGVGTAQAAGAGVIGTPATSAVSFLGQATVDLDAHVMNFAAGELWSADGTGRFTALSPADLAPLRAVATAGTLALSSAAGTDTTGLQRWNLSALLPAPLGVGTGAGGFPVFAGTQGVGGTVDFQVGNRRAGWTGTGVVTELSVERVQGPQAWFLSVGASPVPEPAAWAMMLLGFGAVGWAVRRRAHPADAAAPVLI